jgi:cytidine deaminase
MNELVAQALKAREAAYAPYSGYRVGAALRSGSGQVFTGCNVENVQYGATMCAERTAVFKMVSEGETEFSQIAVATKDGGFPCGACLQVLFEFAREPQNVDVFISDDEGLTAEYKLSDLMPHAFRSSSVNRTER